MPSKPDNIEDSLWITLILHRSENSSKVFRNGPPNSGATYLLHIIPISSKSRSLCYSMEKMSTCSYMYLWFPAAHYYDFSNCILFRYPFSPTTFSSPKFSMTSSLCPPTTIGFLSNYLQWIFSVVTA